MEPFTVDVRPPEARYLTRSKAEEARECKNKLSLGVLDQRPHNVLSFIKRVPPLGVMIRLMHGFLVESVKKGAALVINELGCKHAEP